MFLKYRRLSVITALSLLLALLPLAQTQGRAAQAQHEVGTPFRAYYTQHQGMRILGYPLTDVLDVNGWTAQYFEKGRIEDHRREVVDPNWAFMYGRLTDELFTRQPQGTVNNTSITYADLQRSADPRYRHPAPSGLINGVMPLTGGMFVPYDSQLRAAPGYLVPMIFWNYINRRDLFPGGWLHDIGLPMTDAVTVETIKNGQRRVITMQAFERSVLTYDPLNPADWQVERGNIGADAVQAIPPGPALPPSGAIEVPASNVRVTLPLHIRAHIGQPNERVQAVLRWQDGTILADTFGVLRDPNGQGLLIATLDWTDVLRQPAVTTQMATLELRNQQGSILAQQRVIVLSPNDPGTETIQTYWIVSDRVQAQPRQIPSTSAIGTAVMEELLWGPTTNQTTFKTALPVPADVLAYPRREAGWGDHISLRSLTIDQGIATVDLSRELRAYGCGSERVRLIREQITRTLQQFPAIREVRIAIDGRIDEIFQTPSGGIEIPGPGACVTEPLHLLARAGVPGEQVQATLRWQDGAIITRDFQVLRGEDGHGLLIGSIDWIAESAVPGPGTRAATLELRNTVGQVLGKQSFTVICPYDQCTQSILVYWVSGNALQHAHRRVQKTDRLDVRALEELLWGPSPHNEAGLTTALPTPEDVLAFSGRTADWGPRVRLLSLTIDQGLATANFSKELWAYQGGKMPTHLIREQITRTLQQFPGIREVRIAIDGQIKDVLDQ